MKYSGTLPYRYARKAIIYNIVDALPSLIPNAYTYVCVQSKCGNPCIPLTTVVELYKIHTIMQTFVRLCTTSDGFKDQDTLMIQVLRKRT